MSSTHQESEYQTRRDRIDPQLAAAGWKVVPFDPHQPLSHYTAHAVTEYPTANGPSDYGLFVTGQLLGIVEAKKLTLGPQNVLTQAERYSRGVTAGPFNFRGFGVPFLFSTNGEVIWFHDIRHPLNQSRRIYGFHAPAGRTTILRKKGVFKHLRIAVKRQGFDKSRNPLGLLR